jgi:hypothetical protein
MDEMQRHLLPWPLRHRHALAPIPDISPLSDE